MYASLHTDKVKQQLDLIAQLPASQKAVQLLKMVGWPVTPGYPRSQEPALIQLLLWATEEGAAEHEYDPAEAEAIQQDLMYLGAVRERWDRAIGILLDDDDAPTELMEAETPKEACAAIIGLARAAQS